MGGKTRARFGELFAAALEMKANWRRFAFFNKESLADDDGGLHDRLGVSRSLR